MKFDYWIFILIIYIFNVQHVYVFFKPKNVDGLNNNTCVVYTQQTIYDTHV